MKINLDNIVSIDKREKIKTAIETLKFSLNDDFTTQLIANRKESFVNKLIDEMHPDSNTIDEDTDDQAKTKKNNASIELDAITKASAELIEFIREQPVYACEVFNLSNIEAARKINLDEIKSALLKKDRSNPVDINRAYQVIKTYMDLDVKQQSPSQDYKSEFISEMNAKFPQTAPEYVDLRELLLRKINNPDYLVGLQKLSTKNILSITQFFSADWCTYKYLSQECVWEELFHPRRIISTVTRKIPKLTELFSSSAIDAYHNKFNSKKLLTIPDDKKNISKNLMLLERNLEEDFCVTTFLDDALIKEINNFPSFLNLLFDLLNDDEFMNFGIYQNVFFDEEHFKKNLRLFISSNTDHSLSNFYFFYFSKNLEINIDKELFQKVHDLIKDLPNKDHYTALFKKFGYLACIAKYLVEKHNTYKISDELFNTILQNSILSTLTHILTYNLDKLHEEVFEMVDNQIQLNIDKEMIREKNTTAPATETTPSNATTAPNIPAAAATTTPSPKEEEKTETQLTSPQPTSRKGWAIGLTIGLGIALALTLVAATIFTLGAIHILTLPTALTVLAIAAPIIMKVFPAATVATAEAASVIGTGTVSTAIISVAIGATAGPAIGHGLDKKRKREEVEEDPTAKHARAASNPTVSGDGSQEYNAPSISK